MPVFIAVAYASSNAPAAVPPKASVASKVRAVPRLALVAIFVAYASPASNKPFLAILPTPPDTSRRGTSCIIL